MLEAPSFCGQRDASAPSAIVDFLEQESTILSMVMTVLHGSLLRGPHCGIPEALRLGHWGSHGGLSACSAR